MLKTRIAATRSVSLWQTQLFFYVRSREAKVVILVKEKNIKIKERKEIS
jgi:hypothetical protein